MERYSEIDFKILVALGRFEYLTVPQLVRLGISPSPTYLQKRIKRLVETRKPFIGALDFGAVPSKGRLPRMLHLTPLGAEVLQDYKTPENNLRYPVKARLFSHDFFHRIHTIDVLIGAELWCEKNGHSLTEHHYYFGRGRIGKHGRPLAATHVSWVNPDSRKLENLVPDAVFKVQGNDGKERLFVLELTNGSKWQKDKGKLTAYAAASKELAIEDAFSYPNLARVLFVYEKPPALSHFRAWSLSYNPLKSGELQNRVNAKALSDINNNGFGNDWAVLGLKGGLIAL